jgi:hypothetical protein
MLDQPRMMDGSPWPLTYRRSLPGPPWKPTVPAMVFRLVLPSPTATVSSPSPPSIVTGRPAGFLSRVMVSWPAPARTAIPVTAAWSKENSSPLRFTTTRPDAPASRVIQSEGSSGRKSPLIVTAPLRPRVTGVGRTSSR